MQYQKLILIFAESLFEICVVVVLHLEIYRT